MNIEVQVHNSVTLSVSGLQLRMRILHPSRRLDRL